MSYKVKSSKKPNYSEIELKHFQEEHRKKRASFSEISREGTRQTTGIPEITHRKGTMVMYKERLHIVDKSSPRGVWLQPTSTKEEALENDKIPKKVFVKEKEFEKKVESVFIPVPFYFSPIITGERR